MNDFHTFLSHSCRRGFAFTAAIGALAASSAALAQVEESSTIVNTYSYTLGGFAGESTNAAGNEDIFLTDNTPGNVAEMGLRIEATLDDGDFFFLHNGFCSGPCELTITTDIVFTLTNLGQDPVDLRFDSLITPGHLARSNYPGSPVDSGAIVDFQVKQETDGVVKRLYGVEGFSNALHELRLDTSDGLDFNGLIRQDNEPNWNVLDWSATNLNLFLDTLAPGGQTTLTYSSRLRIINTVTGCADVNECLGFQAAFGDPRARGGVTGSFDFGLIGLEEEEESFPAVGAEYDPYKVTADFVSVGSPLRPNPEVLPELPYDRPYGRGDVGAVPEPSTWALMLLGLAGVGGAMRRRRKGGAPLLA